VVGDINKKDIKILVIDDEQGIRDLLSYELGIQGYTVITAKDGEDALKKIKEENYQLVISDVKMPKMDGVKTLEEIKKVRPDTEVIMATGYGTIETAVASMKKGAYDFIQKPFNIEEILLLIEKALEKAELRSIITLYETSKAIFSAVKFEELLPILVNLSIKLLKADDVSILLMTDDNKLRIAASSNLDETAKKTRIALGERVAGKSAQNRAPYIIVGPLANDPLFKGIESKEEIKSSIIVPMIGKNNVVGVLCASRKKIEEPFTATDLRYANIFTAQISQAIDNAKLYDKLEEKIKDLNDAYAKLSVMQKELVQTEKLAALGELASGVAHELNNPLTVVIGLVQLMLEEGDVAGEKKEDLETIKEQAERCRRIILNLLQFARKHETQKDFVQIEEVLNKSMELVEYDLQTSGVKLVKDFEKAMPPINVDMFKMQQVFLNIINNAFHALKDIKNPEIAIKVKKVNDKIQVSFTDNGSGIPENIQHRIFEPFFTTKDVKCGTGLGLSISYGIIKEHGGEIRVQSVIGKGSTFVMDLPIK
jgi:signal transduction histidine kinase/CheY-like chemotaxis protein